VARFSRMEILNEIARVGVVPVFYHADLEVAKQIVLACREGGARALEFTNRGDNAYRVFSDLVLHFSKADPLIMLGVGSIVDVPAAGIYLSSGANFVVGPTLNADVARLCNRRKVSYSPGCGTASEIAQAEELGVEIVKLFPGDTAGGPAFVKAILGPTPWTRIMPTGGVETTRESIFAWFKAGVAAVGIGSNLIRKEWVQASNFDAIAERTSQVIAWIREARGESLFKGVEHVGLYPYGGASAQAIAEWYGNAFDLQYKEGKSSWFVQSAGTGRIEVMKEGATDRCHVAVEVSNFEAAVDCLRAKGIELEEPKVKPDTKSVFLAQTDPAGNRVHLLWRR
jgi:2-dehydro-3-deoxyphosphogluconate aldolase/(4S)-4-hydroxy-2-oxoglutarate aldolase